MEYRLRGNGHVEIIEEPKVKYKTNRIIKIFTISIQLLIKQGIVKVVLTLFSWC